MTQALALNKNHASLLFEGESLQLQLKRYLI